jgi:hypothetical protein
VWNGLGKGNEGGGSWEMPFGQLDYLYVSNGIIFSRS